MYEDLTFDILLDRMLQRVRNNVDKREGSVIYDAIAPASVELQNAYIEMDTIANEGYPDTATRYWLIKHAFERGITPFEATGAVLKGVFAPAAIEIPIGARFSLDKLNYVVVSKITDGEYRLECEEAGNQGNLHFGTLVPIDYIDGLQTAYLQDVLIPGEDEESTESIRSRLFATYKSQAFGGNKEDYKNKIMGISGVGGVKVYTAAQWNGGGTIKCVIINSAFKKPAQDLVDRVQNAIDPISEEDDGIVPIGHIVTIVGVNEESVDAEVDITYKAGFNFDNMKTKLEATFDEYLLELNEKWDEKDQIIVRIAEVESRMLMLEEVIDIRNTKLNGSENNIYVDADSIAVRGVISEKKS